MSALILKDYYVIFRQMRIFLLLVLVFSCIPGAFYSTFAVVYASMLPYTALAYDERSHWDQMAAMMPYSDRDLVLSKYVFGWLSTAAAAAASFVLQTVLAAVWPGAEGPSVPVILLSVCVAVCILDITLPMMFRFGVEKARLAMFLIIFLVCASAGAISVIDQSGGPDFGFQMLGPPVGGRGDDGGIHPPVHPVLRPEKAVSAVKDAPETPRPPMTPADIAALLALLGAGS